MGQKSFEGGSQLYKELQDFFGIVSIYFFFIIFFQLAFFLILKQT